MINGYFGNNSQQGGTMENKKNGSKNTLLSRGRRFDPDQLYF
jgi:hypothetical protein